MRTTGSRFATSKIRKRVYARKQSTVKPRLLTDQEKRIIERMFPNTYTQRIADKLGRSYSTIANYAHSAGIKKSDEFRQMELARQGERLKQSGAAHRFSKGTIPPNKGKKMSPELYAKCAPTMFKKGQAPHNTTYDGHERISVDGYVEIRVAQGKYVLKHRLVWEQANGPIPEGMALVFKDNNKLNMNLDNLKLVTRAELMARNTIQRYPVELQNTIKTLSKLKKHLYAKEQN